MSASWSSFRSLVSVLIRRSRAGRVRLGDRQVEIHEGVAVAELPAAPPRGRAGRPGTGPVGRAAIRAAPQPAAQAAGDTARTTSLTVTPSPAPCSIRFSRSSGKLRPGDLARRADVRSRSESVPGRSSRQSAAGRRIRIRASPASLAAGGWPGPAPPEGPVVAPDSAPGRGAERTAIQPPRPRAGRRRAGSRSPRPPLRGGCARPARFGHRSAAATSKRHSGRVWSRRSESRSPTAWRSSSSERGSA